MADALAALRRGALEAERRAYNAKMRAQRAALSVSVDRDAEGDVARCAQDAEQSWRECGRMTRKCLAASRVESWRDREERKEAAADAKQYARRADQHADEAELAADGAQWAAKQIEAGGAR